MGLFNNHYEDALYEARIAVNFVKYEEKVKKKNEYMVEQLRKDLNFNLVPCDRDFVKTVMDKDIMRMYEPNNYHSDVVFKAPKRIVSGFNPVEPNLVKIINRHGMSQGIAWYYDTTFLKDKFKCKTYTYDTMKNVDDEDAEIYWRRGFHIKDINTKTVNDVINGEVLNLYNALKKGDEDSIYESLKNIRCVIALNNMVQRYWNKNVCDDILEEKLDKVFSPIESNMKLKEKDLKMTKEQREQLTDIRKEHLEHFNTFRASVKKNMVDAIKKRSSEEFFNALNLNSLEYKKYFVNLENSVKKYYAVEKEIDDFNKAVSAKKEIERQKRKENYKNVTEKYVKQHDERMIETMISKEKRIKLETEILAVVEKKSQSFDELYKQCVSDETQKKAFEFVLKSMVNNNKIRYNSASKKFIPMSRKIVFDNVNNSELKKSM